MAGTLSPLGGAGWQFFTNAGVVLNGGQLFTYAAGSVNTPLATYTDSTLATPNGNPIVLNAYGRSNSEIWLQNNVGYKFVLQDAVGNTLGTWDNVVGINSLVSVANEWVSNNLVVTYVSATTFTVPGDQSTIFTANRRVQYFLTAGTFYGYVSGSVYDGTSTTTVTVVPDSTNLNSSLSAVSYGILNPTNPSVPQNYAQNGGPGSFTTLAANTNITLNVGSAAAPSYRWVAATTTGFYWANPGIGFSVAGVSVGTFTATGFTITGILSGNSLVVNPASPSMTEAQIGSGSGSLAGLYLGTVSNGFGGVWSTALTPSSSNYAINVGATSFQSNASATNQMLVGGSQIIGAVADTASIKGTVLAGNAAAGQIGEVITATNSGGTAISNGVVANITSIALTAGDWDVWGSTQVLTGSGIVSEIDTGISTTSATLPAAYLVTRAVLGAGVNTLGTLAGPVPMQRINVSSSTTAYLVGAVTTSGSAATGTGILSARRCR
jgi:hypothetical protein